MLIAPYSSCNPVIDIQNQDGKEGYIYIERFYNADAVDAMMQYFYTSDYSIAIDAYGQTRTCSPIWLHLQVYLLADMMIGPGELCDMAITKFCWEAGDHWDTEDFAAVINELYGCVPSSVQPMTDAAIRTSTKHIEELLHDDYGVHFRRMLVERDTFGRDFRRAAIDALECRVQDMELYFCQRRVKLFNCLVDVPRECPWCGEEQGCQGHYKIEQDRETEELIREIRAQARYD